MKYHLRFAICGIRRCNNDTRYQKSDRQPYEVYGAVTKRAYLDDSRSVGNWENCGDDDEKRRLTEIDDHDCYVKAEN